MLAVNYTTARNKLKELCDKVSDQDETVIVTRKGGRNVVILSAARYRLGRKTLPVIIDSGGDG